MHLRFRERQHAVSAVREAIDSYPGGLVFSTMDGRPILVNKMMNDLAFVMTGRTVLDANDLWYKLLRSDHITGAVRLCKPWFSENTDDAISEDRVVYEMTDGTVWRFERHVMDEEVPSTVQIEAADFTELYSLSEKLYENNERLSMLHERQKNLLANIMQINHDKELLATKMRIHDEFGRCLVATKKSLSSHTLDEDITSLARGWEDAIRDLTNIPLAASQTENSPEAELLSVADMIGCHIEFLGEQPVGRKALLMLYAAVREALTNAVRHAGADCLIVSLTKTERGCHAEISGNGSKNVYSVREGDGLRNLRRRLEQEGGSLSIRCDGGVVLIVDIPDEEKRNERE